MFRGDTHEPSALRGKKGGLRTFVDGSVFDIHCALLLFPFEYARFIPTFVRESENL